jgi:short-subunit dehydrogenase
MQSGDVFKTTFGPWALVTGASSGIGEEFARQLASKGLNVVLAARRKSLLDNLGDTLRRQFRIETRTVVVDLSHHSAVGTLAQEVTDIDIGLVISNAGTGEPGRFLEQDHAEQLARLRLNALSHFDIAYVFGRRLTFRGRGGMVLAGAMGAIHGIPFMATDAAAKALVQSLGESLHVELGRSGIRVMTLIVPPTDTAIIEKFGLDPSSMPMKPMGAAQCVAEALRSLGKNQSSSLPGALNRTMNGIIPSSLKRTMMAQMIERTLSQRSDQLTQPRALQDRH